MEVEAHDSALPTRIKAAWASGAFGVAVLSNGVSALALFYLVSVVRLDPAVAGLIIFGSKLFDAFSDPFIGWASDRTRHGSRGLGRRRPYLLAGALLSALSFLLVFSVPFAGPFASAASGTGLVASGYVLLTLLLYSAGYSLFNVPFMAMPAEMTQGYHDRSALHGWRVMFASVGGFLSQSMAGVLLELLGKGSRAYLVLGLIGAVLILVSMLVAFFGTRRAPSFERSEKKVPLREQVASFANNVPFQQIMAIKLVQLIGVSASSGGLMFFLVSVIDMPLTKLPLIGGPMTIAVLTCTPLLVWLSRHIGKRGAYALSAALTGLVGLSWMFARPGEADWALALRGAVNGIAFAGNVMFAMSMLTDATELDFRRTGLRREGMYSALYSFVEKFASAIGPLVLGVALSYAGFDAKRPPANVTDEVRQAVLLSITYIPVAMACIAMIIIGFYTLTEARLAEERALSRSATELSQ